MVKKRKKEFKAKKLVPFKLKKRIKLDRTRLKTDREILMAANKREKEYKKRVRKFIKK